jgi:hypothetical protein
MRRDNFTTALTDAAPDDPTLRIAYDGPADDIARRFTDRSEELYAAADIDAAFRLTDPVEEPDATGVLSLSHRVTGEFLLEANAPAGQILDLIAAARDGEEQSYAVRVKVDNIDLERTDAAASGVDADEAGLTYELQALFVYDTSGELLRQHSLIPSGVEI